MCVREIERESARERMRVTGGGSGVLEGGRRGEGDGASERPRDRVCVYTGQTQ